MRKKSLILLRTGGSLVALIAVFAILVFVNVLAHNVRIRADLTEQKLYTLGAGSRTIIAKLAEEGHQVSLKFFVSQNPEMPIRLRNFAMRVADFLKEYEIVSGGNIEVEQFDPKPDSEAEDDALRLGIEGQPVNLGVSIYLGLVAVAGAQIETIPFLSPAGEQRLEYDITRTIYRATHPEKPRVGIMTELPVMGDGGLPFAMPGQPRPPERPAWVMFSNLERDFETEEISTSAEEIDPEIDVLVIVHPKDLSEKTVFAIDQYLLGGGNILAFVDPQCQQDPGSSPEGPPSFGSRPKRASDLNRLIQAWGIRQETDKFVCDYSAITRVRSASGGIEDSPVFLSLDRSNVNADDMITAGVDSMLIPLATSFSGEGAEGLTVTPLLHSSEESAMVGSMMAMMGSDAIRRSFKKGLKNLNLAVRVQGTFKTAFPEGAPKSAEEDEPEPEGEEPDKKAEEEPEKEWLKESTGPSTVILVGDVDMLHDSAWVQEVNIGFGMRARQQFTDNFVFFQGALEQLAGSKDLMNVRSRGTFDRPFDKVKELEDKAQAEWLEKERALQEQLDSTQQRLNELQAKKDQTQRFIISPEQQREIERFRKEKSRIQAELKQVRRALRRDIERLGMWLKIINILAMPFVVAMGGVGFAVYRRSRTKR